MAPVRRRRAGAGRGALSLPAAGLVAMGVALLAGCAAAGLASGSAARAGSSSSSSSSFFGPRKQLASR
jgi:hypothetical protein